jgi:pimeloyl-ACP methyl ester carboxylesterase
MSALGRAIQFDAAGLRLAGCAWGPTHGAPVLILHGFLDQGAAWHEVGARLADALDRPVIAPDHRGHGLSDHVGPGGWYHFWDYVADVDAVVDQLGGLVDVVGHSMGGTVASLFAACRPAKVRRLALIEGLGPPDGADHALERARAFLDERATPPRHGVFASPRDAAARLQRQNDLEPELALALAERVLVRHPEGWTWAWDARHRGRSPTPFREDVHLAMLAMVRAPTLLIEGQRSPWRPPGIEARRDVIAKARYMLLPAAGHNPHHDDPASLAEVLADFLTPPTSDSRHG